MEYNEDGQLPLGVLNVKYQRTDYRESLLSSLSEYKIEDRLLTEQIAKPSLEPS